MALTSVSIPNLADSSTRTVYPLTAAGVKAWQNSPEGQAHRARLDRAAERKREALSSHPFYAKRAAEEEAATGDPLAYWRTIPGVYALMEPEAPKTGS